SEWNRGQRRKLMQTLLERAVKSLKVGLDATASVRVDYVRGTKSIESLKAIPGRTDFEQYTLDESVGTAKAFDWIVAEQDLFLEGKKIQPEPGDQVWFTLSNGKRAIYIAMATGTSRCFDVVDQLGILYRVHTKLDRVETP